MSANDPPATESRRCPYCGCGFEPKTPDQVYCWPGCEEADHKRREAPEAK